MRYPAIVTREGEQILAEFPDCPGCQTFADPGERIEDQAQEALEGWLESALLEGALPPPPPKRAPKGPKVLWVHVPANLAVKIELRRARQAAGLTQAQLAQRAGMSQQAIAKIESLNYRPSLDVIERVARALGTDLDLALSPRAA